MKHPLYPGASLHRYIGHADHEYLEDRTDEEIAADRAHIHAVFTRIMEKRNPCLSLETPA
jgi:hypothetical protein